MADMNSRATIVYSGYAAVRYKAIAQSVEPAPKNLY